MTARSKSLTFESAKKNDDASIKAIKVSPLSASWANTKVDGRDQQVMALLPLSTAASTITVNAGVQNDALLSVTQISTTKPLNVDLVGRRVDVPQITVAGLQATIERGRNGALVLPFATTSVAPAKPSAPVAQVAPAAASTVTTNAWQINLDEISTDKAALALRDQSFGIAQSASAKLDLTLGATWVTGEKTSVRMSGKRISLTDLSLRDDTAKDAWFTVKEIRAAPFETDVLATKVELPKIDIVSPLVNVALGKDGIDVARKLAPVEPMTLTAATKANSATPKISIAGITVDSGRVNFTDGTLPTALTHFVDAITVTADRIELDGSRPITATTNATLASGGVVLAKLKFDHRGNVGEADIVVERVTLAPLSPYLNRNTRLKLGKGEAATAGRLKFSGVANAAEWLRFEGNTALRDLQLINETTLAPFAEWAELSSTDIKVVLGAQGTEVLLADLLLDQPCGKPIIAQMGKVEAPTAQPAASTPSAPVPVDAEKKTRIKVDRLQVTGGNVEYADLSMRPQFGVRISDLAGLILGLSTEPSSRAEVSMEGKADEFGIARLSGNLSPLGATEYADLKATFRNLEMKNLTPYSGKFAGRTIVSGKLSLDLEYKINNLTLGERVDSKDATNLPLDLALALLRDSKGMIDLGPPVQPRWMTPNSIIAA